MEKNLNDSPVHYPERHKKGWGYEDWIWNSELYCGKLLFFEKGRKCSWHYHHKKDEVFYLESGKLVVRYGSEDDLKKSKTIVLKKGECFHVPPGMRHQMEAHSDSRLFEFSTQHFEDDSIRVVKGD